MLSNTDMGQKLPSIAFNKNTAHEGPNATCFFVRQQKTYFFHPIQFATQTIAQAGSSQ
jgi:hypothetical protein